MLNIPAPDANFSAVIGFLDENTGIGTCPANNYSAATRACADQAVPNGALVAKTVSDATLGLVNNPCNSVISGITFDLMDATTDMTNVVVFEDTDANNKGQQFEDKDGNGLPDGVDKYPDYLTRLIYGPEVFGTPASAPLQPLQRSYGQTVVAGTDVSLQFLVMEKGIKIKNYIQARWDVILGCTITDVVAFFIIVSCAATIYASGRRLSGQPVP